MKKIKYQILLLISVMFTFLSCGEENTLLMDANASGTDIADIKLSTPNLVYGEQSELSFKVKGDIEISHVIVSLKIDNANVYEATIPVLSKEKVITEKLLVAFKDYALDKNVTVEIAALNKSLKTSVKTADFTIKRPVFTKLYFVTKDNLEYELALTDEPNVFAIKGNYPQKIRGYVYSESNKKGYRWGMDQTTNKGSIKSEEQFELEDLNAQSISEISFDAVSFAIAPLKKVMSVNGVEFVMSENNSDIFNAFVSLSKDSKLTLDQIDVNEFMFDPVYFNVENGEVTYTGNTGGCKFHLHNKYKFVFIENDKNKLSGTGDLYLNGWGIGWPDLWGNHVDWNFDKAIIMTKQANGKYDFTLAVSRWANFKFYTGRDWGNEIDPTSIICENSTFAVEEESGKPGNYNIYYKPQSEKEVFIVRFNYDEETKKLKGDVLKEIE